jgi:hypothetical protein
MRQYDRLRSRRLRRNPAASTITRSDRAGGAGDHIEIELGHPDLLVGETVTEQAEIHSKHKTKAACTGGLESAWTMRDPQAAGRYQRYQNREERETPEPGCAIVIMATR